MKINKTLAAMGLSLLLAAGPVSAFAQAVPVGAAVTLTPAEAKAKIIDNSGAMVQLEDAIEQLEDGFSAASSGAGMAQQMLYDYENYKQMYKEGTGDLPANKLAYMTYQAMFGPVPNLSNEALYEKFAKNAELADESIYTQLESTRMNRKMLQATLENTADQLIYGVAAMKNGIALQEKVLALSNKQLSDLNAKLKLGKVSAYEVNKQRLSVKKTELQLLKTKRSLENMELQLKDLMGINLDANVRYLYQATPKPISQIRSLEAYTEAALKQRNEVVLAKLELEASEKALNVARAYLKNELLIERVNAENAYLLSESNYNDKVQTVKKDIANAYAELTNSRVQLEILSDKISDAKAQLDKVKAYYKSGYVNEAAVIGAELDYANQLMNYENGIYEYNKKYDNLVLRSGVGLQSAGGM